MIAFFFIAALSFLLNALCQIIADEKGIKNVASSRQGEFYLIGMRYGTDKVYHHFYHRFYPKYLESFRSFPENFGMIEIGVEREKSLLTWLDYFEKAFVYGIDINIEKKGERYEIFKVDQSQSSQLEKFEKQLSRKIFFILDDGSHIPEHQLLTFDRFFKNLLLPGGVYIIEDIETSYWKRGGLFGYNTNYGINHPKSVIEVFKKIVDYINQEFLSLSDQANLMAFIHEKISPETLSLIQSISFAQNCIVITKKTEEEVTFYPKRSYRFGYNT